MSVPTAKPSTSSQKSSSRRDALCLQIKTNVQMDIHARAESAVFFKDFAAQR
jgi:hypothetical protein